MNLTDEEIRVLGCLIEKEATTPDSYPLSTNALVNACNQKSNRYPVVDYPERLVVDTMLLLRPAGLARTVTGGRADKHRHVLDEALGFDLNQLAVLAVMMLRGPQSAGELRTRTERYPTSLGSGFETLSDIDRTLESLSRGDDPFVANIGRGSGQSQDRWAHLLGDEAPPTADEVAASNTSVAGSRSGAPSLAERVEALEERLERLEAALGVAEEPAP